jgi:hypothetical protein
MQILKLALDAHFVPYCRSMCMIHIFCINDCEMDVQSDLYCVMKYPIIVLSGIGVIRYMWPIADAYVCLIYCDMQSD